MDDDELMHVGTPRHSGRYPWGSGENPHQRNQTFLSSVDKLKKQGLSETQIAEGLGINTTQLRARKAIAKNQERQAAISEAQRLKEKGMSNVAIGERMGLNESSVRALLNPSTQAKNDILANTAEMLKGKVDEQSVVDIGTAVNRHLGISSTDLKTAVAMLEEEGTHKVQYLKVPQLGTGKFTNVMVLAPADMEYRDILELQRQGKIGQITGYSEDRGRSFEPIRPPVSVDSKRVEVRYGDEGGADMDGVIQVRRGVDDVSLGNAKYAQVRIAVDGSHYLKGMAMYADDLPDGVDLRFNTNKKSTGNKLDAMKGMKDDPENPFGATTRQITYDGPDGTKKISVMNIVNEEGAWGDWSKSLSSQMLSKQSPGLAKKQLELKFDSKKAEYDEIMSLTNPAVKKKLLESFADDMDSSAVHLKAAALPRQSTQVILPINSLKDTEIYAPNYRNGEKVVLVRYPHGGIFEIPELTVNNRNSEGNQVMKNARDAVGINSKVAGRLSGADFDGDTVLVIPNDSRSVKTSSPLKELKGFDPQTAYPAYEGMKPMSARTKQTLMGDVSNLITDMTIQGAPHSEIARAVKHSMVVIDAEKHKLNYKQSAADNRIAELKQKYQGSARAGAATLISRSSSQAVIPERKFVGIDPETGKKRYEPTGKSYTNKNGKLVEAKTRTTKMAIVDDADELISQHGTVMESVYANHANRLKSLANEARKAYISTPSVKQTPGARETYSNEVNTLKAKLNVALKNAPLERQAQLIANANVRLRQQANPDMDNAELKKIKGQELTKARLRTGAKKERVDITSSEWEAIQSGAISNNMLNQILNNADMDKVKALATPRATLAVDGAKLSRARSMLSAGYTQAEVADALGVSTSTLNKSLNGKED